MALLILFELAALSFAMTTLSAVRAFVEGEALWSKSQKNAVQSLQHYAMTKDPAALEEFQQHLRIPKGDHHARVELDKPNPSNEAAFAGFIQGGIHPDDVQNVINVIVRFNRVSYIKRAVAAWSAGDDLLQELVKTADKLRDAIENNRGEAAVREVLIEIGKINLGLTSLERDFSAALGEGSRWLERLLFLILFFAVLTVESTGLLLTFSFSRNLSRSLKELSTAAQQVGRGNFNQQVPVRALDELGQLAIALNTMISDLKINIGQRQKAENANQTKTLFLANVSHELRTPLGVILGYIELLKDSELSEAERIDYLNIVDQTGRNLNRIVNDILDISKVETGHIDLKLTTFSLRELVHELERMLEMKAQSKKVKLVFTARHCESDYLQADRDRIHQILVNLINNALKFTQSGTVEIIYELRNDRLNFEVRDTGIGIPREHQDRLFKHFSQVDPEFSQNQQGAGLGLALSRGLARTMGGDLELQSSEQNVGSTFLFWTKVKIESQAEQPKVPSIRNLTALRGKKVLVVDDAAENQMLIKLFLTREGVKVDCADDGQQAVEKANKTSYDLILMDMQMPIMNGFEATQKLRAQGHKEPIVAFTANAMKGDERRCLEVGCNSFLSKPVARANLLNTLAGLLEH